MPFSSRVPIRIVENIMSVTDICEEKITFVKLLSDLHGEDTLTAMKWLAARQLLHNSLECPHCNNLCRLIRYTKGLDGWRWRCTAHKFCKSIRTDSLFANRKISLKNMIIMMFMWVSDYPQSQIAKETCLSPKTLVDFCNFQREICKKYLEDHPQTLGGIDDNGESIIVEIDESKFFHRKYHRGTWHVGHWVFGAIERHSGRCCVIEVPDRRRETLMPIIRRWILPGSRIISDGWAAYAQIENESVYKHDVIVHQSNFVDPNNTEIHTQSIENTWMRAKRKIRRQFGTSQRLFPSYLNEFLWRNRFRDGNLFFHFLVCVIEQYPLN
ncbi:hypothetical protein Ahia01_000713200 [Argonauta hians]